MPKLFRSGRLAVLLLFATLIVSQVRTLPAAEKAEGKKSPPNVVMIISDDQAWNDYGFMGHPVIQTPHLDRLAEQSATFTRGYVPSSLCRPSLATMATGLFPHQHMITGNDPPKGTDRNLMLKHIKNAPSLPRILGEHGYMSLQTGKWWEGAPSLGGFTHAMTHGDTTRGGRHGDEGLKVGRQGLQPIADFLDETQGNPFFLWYAPFLPHTPHNPPERILKKYLSDDRPLPVAKYYAMCDWFDETCGDLLKMLDDRKLSDNTLVLYVTDNGWIQNPKSNGYAAKSKRSPYDGGLRTPIMVRWPGHAKPHRDDTTPVSSIDLVPTVLAACDIECPKELPGLNLLPVCEGQPIGRKMLFGEIFEHDVADIDDPSQSLLYRWCYEEPWKLILPAGKAQAELYNVVEDPHETKDLAKQHPEVVKKLTAAIDQWWDGK